MPSKRTTPLEVRFWARADIRDGCWNWIGTSHQGYGRIKSQGRTYIAPRLAYRLIYGDIPDGLTIDHLCCNVACVRPDHFELVTSVENVMRGSSPAAMNARKTHCKRGHEFTPENTYTYNGQAQPNHRLCLTCKRVMDRERWRRMVARHRGEMVDSSR